MRVVPTKRLTMLAAIGSVLAILSMACGGGKETDPVKLLPEGSTLIAHLNLSGLLASDASTSFIDGLPLDEDEPQTLEEVLDEGMTETGVDFRQISQVSFFTDPLRDEEFTGIIASGDFNEVVLISSIRAASDSPLSTSDYRGRKLYSSEDDSDSFTLAVLEGDVLVAGTAEAVRAVIDVQDGNRDRLSGGTMDAFNDLGLGLIRLQADLSSSDFGQRVPRIGRNPFSG